MRAPSDESSALVWGALGAAIRGDRDDVDLLLSTVPRSELRGVLGLLICGLGEQLAAMTSDPAELAAIVRDIAAKNALRRCGDGV